MTTPISSTEAVAKWLVEKGFETPRGDSDMYRALELEKHLEKLGFKIVPPIVPPLVQQNAEMK